MKRLATFILRDWPTFILLLALVISNLIWACYYHKLWYDDAQANAWLDWDEQYMEDFQKHEQELLVMTGGYCRVLVPQH